ncbi:MAG TPA: DUF2169 domain-containing protein [Lamprocystis sp. (in: g-proteobacteria)]|nr:DUF2169 domain-containing protein [Lamprocystis sp. (in: g-proteobacteria)]
MLQLANQTPFSAALSVLPDTQGIESAYAVVKATFALTDTDLVLAEQQLPLLAADVFWGDPVTTGLRAVGEFALPKPATDVLLVARAVAEHADTRVLDVSLRVGPLQKTVRVFGNRRWERAGDGWLPTPPEPFERLPLRWEFAFGGCATATDGAPPDYEPRNPVGRGFIGREEKALAGRSLPNLEDPRQLIRSPADRPPPACFAPIAPTWAPRKAYVGTYDETWQQQRAPYLPHDFDSRYFQVAPADQIAPGFLVGGEPVEIRGCSLGDAIRFALPICSLELEFDFDGAHLPVAPKLETVLLEPDKGRVQLLWRAGIAVDKRLLKLREVIVYCREYPRQPAQA